MHIRKMAPRMLLTGNLHHTKRSLVLWQVLLTQYNSLHKARLIARGFRQRIVRPLTGVTTYTLRLFPLHTQYFTIRNVRHELYL
jgi:hypothetical protein